MPPRHDASSFSGFHLKTRQERLDLLVETGHLTPEGAYHLAKAVQSEVVDVSEHFIENVVGCMPMPLGVVPNVMINGQARMVPMAVEETSIIAALNKTAKWVRQHGTLNTQRHGHEVIGQIQMRHVRSPETLHQQLERHRQTWLESVNQHVLASLVKRGGGATHLHLRVVPRADSGNMAVIHLTCNTCEAMGANLINQACEHLKPLIEACTGHTVDLCIVSNLTDTQLTTATLTLDDVDADLGQAIAEASHFANQDPYRACTHNKGIMNGIDPILIATGNDWRAVEAGMHAYATQKDGAYRALSSWDYHAKTKRLTGILTAPICVGTVGGVTTLHPTVQHCIKMLAVKDAEDLAGVCAAVGLLQNLAALKALTTQGIVQGHMQLHINNLIVAAGAEDFEVDMLKKRLQHQLTTQRKITMSDAQWALKTMRDATET